MSQAVPAPFDVKLMNLTATLLFAVCIVVAGAALLWWTARGSMFSIRGITVRGDIVHTSALAVRANVMPQLTGNLFTVDLGAARQAFESVPWVRRAVVSREFPDRLEVVLREQQAVALWGDAAGSQMVNTLGEVFEANVGEVEQDQLPRLLGPAAQAAHVLDMYRAIEPLFAALDQSIDQLELNGRGSWRLKLDSGGEIELGTGSIAEVVARAEGFSRSILNVVKTHDRDIDAIESADLRYGDGYALRLAGVTTTAEPLKHKPGDKR